MGSLLAMTLAVERLVYSASGALRGHVPPGLGKCWWHEMSVLFDWQQLDDVGDDKAVGVFGSDFHYHGAF